MSKIEQNSAFAGTTKTMIKKTQPRKDYHVSVALNRIERRQIEIERNKELCNFYKLSEDIDDFLQSESAGKVTDEQIGDGILDSISPDDILSKYFAAFQLTKLIVFGLLCTQKLKPNALRDHKCIWVQRYYPGGTFVATQNMAQKSKNKRTFQVGKQNSKYCSIGSILMNAGTSTTQRTSIRRFLKSLWSVEGFKIFFLPVPKITKSRAQELKIYIFNLNIGLCH